MAKKHVSKVSGMIVDESVTEDPVSGSREFANTIIGRMIILDPKKSKIAKTRKITQAGEYAINWR